MTNDITDNSVNTEEDYYVVYSVSGCKVCQLAKEAFNRSSVPYQEVVINKDMDVDVFSGMFPNERCCPFITVNGKKVGDIYQLVKKLVSIGKLKKSDE